MGIVSILVATILILLFLAFSVSPFSPFKQNSQINSKQVEQSATDAVNSALEKSKLEESQVKNLDQ